MERKIYVFKDIPVKGEKSYTVKVETEDKNSSTIRFGTSTISTAAEVIATDYGKENLLINFRPKCDFESEAGYTPFRCLPLDEQEIQKFIEAFQIEMNR